MAANDDHVDIYIESGAGDEYVMSEEAFKEDEFIEEIIITRVV